MKKTFFVVALMAMVAMGNLMAQDYKYVSPIELEMMQFNLQELRDSAVNNDAYKMALTSLQKQLTTEKEAIENATASLKAEYKYYDAQLGLYKSRKKQYDDMVSDMQSNIKAYESMLKDIKKQYDILKKVDNNTCDAIRNHTRNLDAQEKDCETAKRRCEHMLSDIQAASSDHLSGLFTVLGDFQIELTDKETRLKNMAAQNKTNIEIVKSALKALK